MSDGQRVEAVAQAYAEAWRRDLGENVKHDVPTWAEMSEPQRDAMRRCTRAALAVQDDARDAEIKRLRSVLERIARTGEGGASDQHAPDMWEACRTWACDALNGGDDEG
jgi:hypothetical protein